MKFPRKQIKANARAALSANYWPLVGYPFLLGLILLVVLSAISIRPLLSMAQLATSPSIYSSEELILQNMGSTVTTNLITIVLSIFVLNVIAVGELYFYYKFYSGSRADFGTFFDGFKNGQYWHIVGGMVLMAVFLLLWSMPFALVGAVLFSVGLSLAILSPSAVVYVLMVVGAILYFVGLIMVFVKSYQYLMIPYLLIDKPEFTVKECFDMTKKMTKGNKWSLFVLDLSFIGWIILSCFTLFLLAIFYVEPYMGLAHAGSYDYLKRVYMPEPVEGPAFQSASYEADFATINQPVDNTGTLNNTTRDDIFDE